MKKIFYSIFPNRRQALTFLICLLLASIIWTVNALNSTYSFTVQVPVWYGGREAVAGSQLVQNLNVEVKGRGFDLLRFQREVASFRAEALPDPLKTGPVSSRKLIEPLLASYKRSLQLEQVQPAYIAPSSVGLFSRKVALRCTPQLTFRMPYVAAGPAVIYPDSVNVISAAPLPESLRTLEAEAPILRDLHASHFGPLPLLRPQEGWMTEPAQVWLYVPVERGTELKLQVPVGSRSPADEMLIPSGVELTMQVPLSKYELTHAGIFRLGINPDTDPAGKALVKVEHAPYWVSHLSIHPASVTRLKKVK